jgi:hypothetical protein
MFSWFSKSISAYVGSTNGRISVSTRSRAEIVGEGRGGVRAEARAPATGRRRAAWARQRREAEAAARVWNSDSLRSRQQNMFIACLFLSITTRIYKRNLLNPNQMIGLSP